MLDPTSPTPIASHQMDIQTNQVSFCWSGKRTYQATSDGAVRILSFPDFTPVINHTFDRTRFDGPAGAATREYRMKGHTGSCLSVELSPNGRYLATGGTDSLVCLYDTDEWLCRRTLTDLVGPVKGLSFTHDGYYVCAGSDVDIEKGQPVGIDIFHVESGDKVYTFKTASSSPVVAWAPLKYQLAYCDLGQLRIVGVETDKK